MKMKAGFKKSNKYRIVHQEKNYPGVITTPSIKS